LTRSISRSLSASAPRSRKQTTLTGLGVAEPAAQIFSNQIGTVQKAVTHRKRRW
jgi:hypothetical protein